MNTRMIFAVVIGLVVVAGLVIGLGACRTGYATAPSKTVLQQSGLEIREYGELALASTFMGGDNGNNSFGRLFRYISGDNAAEQKISMTTPVFIGDLGEGKKEMAFVMPVKLDQPPKPKSEEVVTRKLPAGTFAVWRFSGLRSAKNEAQALAKAREQLKKTTWQESGEPFFAYFDPPWTPGPMRRNEVMIPVKAPPLSTPNR